ncbi:LVIVD repeat-containing protein [Haladaptatus sp. NG-WS-4]
MSDDTSNTTDRLDRRRFLALSAATGSALGLATGTASAHNYGSDSGTQSTGGHDHTDESAHQQADRAELLDYHSLGGVGASSNSGRPEEPHYGAITELHVHGDYAYVGVFSSDDPTNDRGMAILDIHEFNDAETLEEARDAELSVLSFVRNDDPASAVMDARLSDDGKYVFMSKQPYTALFNETDPTPGTDGDSTDPSAGSVVAVDVEDPGNPTVVGSYNAWTTGSHNACYHRIDGEEYVFACKDMNDGTAGLYVLQFDRTTGQFVLVDRWTASGATGGLDYIHDITIQNDPKTGTPTGYLSYWDKGLRILDLSDPTAITELAVFEMNSAHFAEPAPTLLDGKRVVVVGQEVPSVEDGSSGKLYLLDADGIEDGESPTELDVWEWKSSTTFQNFTLSPHNFDVTECGWVHLGHYHGGVRFLDIDTDDWVLREEGFYLPHEDVPEESKMQGLNEATPFTWCAVEQDGVTYVADVNTGVYAIHHDYVPFGNDSGPGVHVTVERADDGSAFTGGQTNQVDLTIAADESVHVRDRVPSEWSVVGGDAHTTYVQGGDRYVEFVGTVDGDDRTYFAEAPNGVDETGSYTFGPVEYSTDGETWHPLPGTTEENSVLAASTAGIGTLGIAATGTALYRVRSNLRRLLGEERE